MNRICGFDRYEVTDLSGMFTIVTLHISGACGSSQSRTFSSPVQSWKLSLLCSSIHRQAFNKAMAPPRPAKSVPAKIVKRWKVWREKEDKEDAHFAKVEENKTKVKPMLGGPVGRREKAELKNSLKKVFPKKPDNHW